MAERDAWKVLPFTLGEWQDEAKSLICFCAVYGFTDVLPWRKWLAGKQAERK